MPEWTPSMRVPDIAVKDVDASFARSRLPLAKVERLAAGVTRWAEGPVYFGDLRCLLWSDVPGNCMWRWDEQTGAVGPWRKPSDHANGNTRDRQGRLLSCEHGTRRVTRTEIDGSITVLADRFAITPEELRTRIQATTLDYAALRRPGGALIEIYCCAGDRVFSFYRFDDTAVVGLYSHARSRATSVPVFVCSAPGELFHFVSDELAVIQQRSRPL